MFEIDETIAALASASGNGPRSIIRVSGVRALDAARVVFNPADNEAWVQCRRAMIHRGRLRLKSFADVVACNGYAWPTTRSYTGQPMVELHLWAGANVVDMLLTELYKSGVRPARAGEFTLRAFLAGRMDLAQAEAVLGVIDADDHVQLHQSLSQLAGGLSGRISQLRGELLSLLADLEAGLDFVEEDIEFVSRAELLYRVEGAAGEVRRLLHDATGRWRDSASACVVIAGLPNAGKSTLFNALVDCEEAIVSPVAGTTRDWLSARMDLLGTPVEIVDIAGWEQSRDALTTAMAERRDKQLERADVILWCSATDMGEEETALDFALQQEYRVKEAAFLHVQTKLDLGGHYWGGIDHRWGQLEWSGKLSKTNQLTETIRFELANILRSDPATDAMMLGSTAARGRASLQAAKDALDHLIQAAEFGFGDEVLSAELRAALDGLAAVVGEIYTDDVLDVIFSRFCIGK